MSLINYSPEILATIISLLDNKTNVCLIRTCKYIYNHGEEFGYLSYIKIKYGTNMMNFFHNFCKHSYHIKTVDIYGMDNPHLWIPVFVQNINFDNCSISEYLNPGKQAHITKKLRLTDYNRYKNNNILKVNWECFQNLEELVLYVYDVDLTGIEKLKRLSKININTMKSK
jgi:hypothetical protein